MSNNKSLGSSPIGFKSESRSMGFIPDLGADKKNDSAKSQLGKKRKGRDSARSSPKGRNIEKKTVSYYLDARLIAKVKSIARDNDLCYSALVSKVLHRCLSESELT